MWNPFRHRPKTPAPKAKQVILTPLIPTPDFTSPPTDWVLYDPAGSIRVYGRLWEIVDGVHSGGRSRAYCVAQRELVPGLDRRPKLIVTNRWLVTFSPVGAIRWDRVPGQ